MSATVRIDGTNGQRMTFSAGNSTFVTLERMDGRRVCDRLVPMHEGFGDNLGGKIHVEFIKDGQCVDGFLINVNLCESYRALRALAVYKAKLFLGVDRLPKRRGPRVDKELRHATGFARPFADDPGPMASGRESDDEYDYDTDAAAIAEQRGLIVIFPKPNQLQLDLDSDEDWQEYKRRMGFFQRDNACFYKADAVVTASASGLPHRHVTISFKDRTFTEPERIALQAALGSDPVREFLNMLRYERGVEFPTRLFERPTTENHEQS